MRLDGDDHLAGGHERADRQVRQRRRAVDDHERPVLAEPFESVHHADTELALERSFGLHEPGRCGDYLEPGDPCLLHI